MKSTLLGMAMAICCLEVKAQQLEFLLTDTTTQIPVRLIHRYRTLQKTPIGSPKMLIYLDDCEKESGKA